MSRLERSHSTRHSNVHRSGCAKCYFYFRQVTTFLFSHIGLCALLIGYALIGAFMFKAIESENEKRERDEYLKNKDSAIHNLSLFTQESLVLDSKKWKHKAADILEEFEKQFLHAVRIHGLDENPSNDSFALNKMKWSFSGALLYSIIVITTIGYGNVAPRTYLGKMTTILYAIIGIPLMLLCLSNIGQVMAHLFKFVYWKCCCYLCVKPKGHKRILRRKRRLIRQQQRALLAAQMSSCCVGDNSTCVSGGNSTRNNLNLNVDNRQFHQRHLPSPIEVGNQSASTYASSSGPLLNNGQPIFFDQLPIEFHEIVPSYELPEAANMGRNFSTKHYHDQQQKSPTEVQQFRTSYKTPLPQVKANKNELSPVICNRFASYSDECIPTRLENSKEPITSNTSKLSIPPRRTQSQVKFQRPKILNRRWKESEDVDNRIISTQQSSLQLQSYIDSNTLENSEQTYQKENQPYSDDRSLSVFGTSYAQTVPYFDFSDLESNDNDSEFDDDEFTEKNIPITVCLLLVVGYICGGAWFFSVFETMRFFDAFYFCFITLSTIGFGDIVPGRTVFGADENSQLMLAYCALYLLFGMALLAMSLNLVKEKVIETVRTIGERIGLLVNDEDKDFY